MILGVARQPYSHATKVVAPQGFSSKADYYTDGIEDEEQINAAIIAINAAGGGTLHIAEGTYIINTPILPLPNVNIEGRGYATLLRMTRTDLSRAIISINPTTTQGGTAAVDTIIDFNIIIKNLRIEGAGKNLYASLINQRGIYGYCAKGIKIYNCHISNIPSSGIALQQCPNHIIRDNIVFDVGYNCIGSGEWLATNSIINGNIVYNSGVGYCGIEVNGSEKITISDNIIFGCSYGIRHLKGSEGCQGKDIVVANNHVFKCGLRGLYILNTYEVNLLNNNVKRCTGGITSFTVTNGGSGYSANPTISVATGTGSGASLTPNLTGGVITSVTVNNGGSGYSLAELIVTGATGQGAVLKPVITGGAITSVIVINGGAEYTSPVITVSPGVGGGCVASATVVNGVITAITVVNSGYGYPASASVVVTITDSTGTGATATAVSATGGYGGIDLENATRCNINGNEVAYCASNGIYLQQSTYNSFVGNNIHDNRLIDTSSDGIKLADKNGIASSYNSFVGNKCYDTAWFGASRQRYGINLIGTASYNNIRANDLLGNATAPLGNTSTGVCNNITENNGTSTIDETKFVRMKNTSGGDLAIGDVVVLKAVASGDEVTTSTTAGDQKVFGIAAEAITNNSYGYIQVLGKTTALKVDGTTNIAIGDFLSCFTTVKIAQKATIGSLVAVGDMAFAIALEAYTTDNSSGVIDALLITPRKV